MADRCPPKSNKWHLLYFLAFPLALIAWGGLFVTGPNRVHIASLMQSIILGLIAAFLFILIFRKSTG